MFPLLQSAGTIIVIMLLYILTRRERERESKTDSGSTFATILRQVTMTGYWSYPVKIRYLICQGINHLQRIRKNSRMLTHIFTIFPDVRYTWTITRYTYGESLCSCPSHQYTIYDLDILWFGSYFSDFDSLYIYVIKKHFNVYKASF